MTGTKEGEVLATVMMMSQEETQTQTQLQTPASTSRQMLSLCEREKTANALCLLGFSSHLDQCTRRTLPQNLVKLNEKKLLSTQEKMVTAVDG